MFSSAVIITLALGLGVNGAVFGALESLVFRNLSIPDASGLIGVTSRDSRDRERYIPFLAINELAQDGPFSDVCGYNGGAILPVEANSQPTQAVVAFISGHCFETFGVTPILGRAITDEDAPLTTAGSRVAVLGHQFWIRVYGGDPTVIGKTIRTNGAQATVVGVLPSGFMGLHIDTGIDIFAPPDSLIPARADRRPVASQVLGRLKPGVTLDQARAELVTRWPALLKASVPDAAQTREGADLFGAALRVESMAKGMSTYRERYSPALKLVLGLTIVLLLLAAANLGGLLLSRLETRAPEIAIRTALGGPPSRIASQLLLESAILCGIGVMLAVPVSYGVVALLLSFVPPSLVPSAIDLAPNYRILGFTAVMGAVVAFLMTCVPVFAAFTQDSRFVLTMRTDRTVARPQSRLAKGMLAAQVALSTALLISASLLTTSLYRLHHNSLGVRSDGILTVKLLGIPDGYRGMDTGSYYRALQERIAGLPGVQSVGLSRLFPRTLTDPVTSVAFSDEELGDRRAYLDSATAEFFHTVGIPILQGRVPTFEDGPKTRKVAAISDSLARALSPTGDVVGRRIRFGTDKTMQDIEVVGIVGSATIGNPRTNQAPVVYLSPLQITGFSSPNVLVSRQTSDPALTHAVRKVIAEAGREYAHEIVELENLFARAPSTERMTSALASAIAAFALVLALVGLQSAFSYAVARRTREFGVRVAVGAAPSGIAGNVLREAATVTLVGLVIGVAGAVVGSSSLRSLVFGIQETDTVIIATCVAVVLLSSLTAVLVPALRAARVDPIIALRGD
jgi:putative ABC transport system permease protein